MPSPRWVGRIALSGWCHPERSLASGTARAFYMSGMRAILGIALSRDVPSHHEPNEKGERPLGTLPTQRDLNRGVAEDAEDSLTR